MKAEDILRLMTQNTERDISDLVKRQVDLAVAQAKIKALMEEMSDIDRKINRLPVWNLRRTRLIDKWNRKAHEMVRIIKESGLKLPTAERP